MDTPYEALPWTMIAPVLMMLPVSGAVPTSEIPVRLPPEAKLPSIRPSLLLSLGA